MKAPRAFTRPDPKLPRQADSLKVDLWWLGIGIDRVLHFSVRRVVSSRCKRSSTNGWFLEPLPCWQTKADRGRFVRCVRMQRSMKAFGVWLAWLDVL